MSPCPIQIPLSESSSRNPSLCRSVVVLPIRTDSSLHSKLALAEILVQHMTKLACHLGDRPPSVRTIWFPLHPLLATCPGYEAEVPDRARWFAGIRFGMGLVSLVVRAAHAVAKLRQTPIASAQALSFAHCHWNRSIVSVQI